MKKTRLYNNMFKYMVMLLNDHEFLVFEQCKSFRNLNRLISDHFAFVKISTLVHLHTHYMIILYNHKFNIDKSSTTFFLLKAVNYFLSIASQVFCNIIIICISYVFNGSLCFLSNRQALCCKMSAEFDTFIKSQKS